MAVEAAVARGIKIVDYGREIEEEKGGGFKQVLWLKLSLFFHYVNIYFLRDFLRFLV